MSDTLLSIFTLYRWDETLFDNIAIPPLLDKDILVDNLVVELAEFEILYADPDMMKYMIEKWSNKELKKWQDLYDTTVLEYDPIENFNRTETGTETETRDLDKTNLETRNLTGSNDETRNLASSGTDNTIVDSESNRSGDDTQVKSTNAYNETTVFTDSEKDVTTLGTKEETDSIVDVTLAGTDTGTVNKAITDAGTVSNAEEDNGTITNERNLNMKGNIGVTTTQQMIEQERKSVEFNIYDYIINSFKLRFCITVY